MTANAGPRRASKGLASVGWARRHHSRSRRDCKRSASTGLPQDVTVFRLNATAVGRSRLQRAFLRNTAARVTHSRRLITWRSQVQILPPLLEGPGNGAFLFGPSDLSEVVLACVVRFLIVLKTR
jgi:hypothetical protein